MLTSGPGGEAEPGSGRLGNTHQGLPTAEAGSPGWELLGFFSKKLEPAQVKYSAFGCELLACFLGIPHFRFMLDGRAFTIYADHKPLTTAINCASDPWTAWQCRQLAYMAEYTSDIRHIAGTSNVVADALSRPPVPPPPSPAAACVKAPWQVSGGRPMGRQVEFHSSFSCGECGGARALGDVDYAAMAAAQGSCPEVQKVAASPALQVWRVQIHGADVLCDVSTGVARPPSMGWHTQVSGLRDAWCRAGSCGTGAPQTWSDGTGIARPAREGR
jgi:hypothetical protein